MIGMKRIGALAAIFAVTALATRYTASAEDATQVSIDNFSFTPATLTVKAGTKVTWTNRDDIPHTVVTADKKLKSTVLDTDDTFVAVFDQPGTYTYFCSIHPHMTGTVVVVP